MLEDKLVQRRPGARVIILFSPLASRGNIGDRQTLLDSVQGALETGGLKVFSRQPIKISETRM